MTALLGLIDMVPRWLLLAIIAALAGTACVERVQLQAARVDAAQAQRDTAHARADVATLQAAVESARADAEAQAASWATQLTEAERNGRKRENELRAAADAAGAELDGLRGDIDALRVSLKDATAAAATERAIAVAAVFQQCSRRYSELAARADRHVNDIRTLIEAWPR